MAEARHLGKETVDERMGAHARLRLLRACVCEEDVGVLAVGDERFIQKCLGRIAQYRREGGTMLLVTHDASTEHDFPVGDS